MLSYLWQDSFHYRFRCMLRVKYNVNNTKMTYHDNAHTFRTVGSRTHWYFNPWIFWVPAGRRSDHTAMPTGLRRPVDAKRHDADGTYDFAFVHRPVSTGHGPTQFAAQSSVRYGWDRLVLLVWDWKDPGIMTRRLGVKQTCTPRLFFERLGGL